MLAHGHTMGSIAQIDDIHMRGITQMYVDGQFGRSTVDVLTQVVQCIHGAVGSSKIPDYKDISSVTWQYIAGPEPEPDDEATLRSILIATGAPPEAFQQILKRDEQ